MTHEFDARLTDSRAADLLARAIRLLRDSLADVTQAAAQAWDRHERHREARAIRGALSELDDRTLCDLGFHRSEIGSIAAEATGEAERTRVRAPLRPRGPR
jgi:uncharacterized protein YjiS (DUF1127 family)